MDNLSAAPLPLSSATPVHSRRFLLVLYTGAAFLYWMTLYLYVPTLPVYAESKSDNLALVGVVLSMYGLWQAVVRLPLGIMADWLGRRKPFIIVGLALAGLGAWVMGTAEHVNGLILGRAITGLAAGTWVPLLVVFNSLFPPEESVRATVILTLVGSVGRMMATGATGTLNNLGGYSLAFFLATGAAALAILLVLPAHEVPRPRKPPSVRRVGRLAARADVLVPSLLSAVSQYANWAATFGFIPILAKGLGATGVTQSILVSMNVAVLTLGNLVATAIVKRTGARPLIYASFILMSIGLTGAALAPTLFLIFFAQFCIGLSQGVGYPVLMGMSIRYVEEAQRSTAMGLHQAVYAVGMFAGPWLSGILADAIGIPSTFLITAVATLALGIVGIRWLRE